LVPKRAHFLDGPTGPDPALSRALATWVISEVGLEILRPSRDRVEDLSESFVAWRHPPSGCR
jgi:hypothetical protein